jgi:hypothetical protein
MFLVARPQHSHQPMFTTADTLYPRYEATYPAFYDEDQAYLEAQYVTRLRARHRDEAVRQRARAAALRAQQRREYERQLVIRAAEEEAYARYVAHTRAREAAMRQAEAHRQAHEEQQRLAAAARRDQALKAVTFQRMVRYHHIFIAIRLLMRHTQIHAILRDALAEKTDEDAKLQPAPAPIAESQSPESALQKSIQELLCERASTETDPELLVTLNGLLQTLLPPPATSPSTSSSTAPVPAATSAETSAPASPATPAPAPTATFTRQPSLETLDRLSTTFSHITSTFTLPTVDFSRPSTPDRSSSPTTHLSFTTANRPIHEYEAALSKLLTELDAVDSDGDDAVRMRRRELVKSVEAALADLDAAIAAQRREHDQHLQEPSVEHTVAAVSADDVLSHDVATSTETAMPTSTIEIVAPVPVHASQAPSSLDTAFLATAPVDDVNAFPEDNTHIVADTDAADVDTASSVVEQNAADIPPTVDTAPAELDTPSTDEADIATAPATSPLSDHATHDTAAEPAPVAPSPIMAPLSSMDTKTDCDGEEHAQSDTPSLSLCATSSDLRTTGADFAEEAVLLDGINSEDDWSEADA